MLFERLNHARAYVAADGLGPFLVRSVAGTGAVRIASMVASFLVGIQLARGLGPEGYGYYGLALAVVTLAGVPGEMGLPSLITREIAAAKARGDTRRLFGVLRWGRRVASRLSAAMALLVLILGIGLAQARPSALALALIAGAPIIPFLALAKLNGGALRGLHQIVRGQIPANLLRPVIMSLVLLLMYLYHLKLEPWYAVALNVVTAAIAWMVAAIWLNQRLPRQAPAESLHETRRLLSSMIPIAFTQGMQALQGQMSVLLLGLLAGAAEVGLFRISVATAVMLSAPQTIMLTVASPLISKLYAENDKVRLQVLLTRAAQVQFGGVLLLSVPLLIAPAGILSLVYGHDYAPAANVLRVVLLGQLITSAFGLNGSVLTMTRYERRVTRAVAIGLLINAISFLVLVPLMGSLGAAIGFSTSVFAWNALAWLDALKFLCVDTSFVGFFRDRASRS